MITQGNFASNTSDAVAFRNEIFRQFYHDVHSSQANNYSYERFSYDGVDRSTLFTVNKHVLFLAWFCDTYPDVFRAWSVLADAASKQLYADLIRFRLAGHLHVRIRARAAELAPHYERLKTVFLESPSAVGLSGMFGALRRYSGHWEGRSYDVDTVKDGLAATLAYGQYFFERAGVSIRPTPGDHIIDAGSFTGDTAILFSQSVGSNGRVYAFDPVANHLEICALNFSRLGASNITLFPLGVGNRNTDIPPVRVDEYLPGYRASSSDVPVPMCRIDDLVADGRIERIDFLKMDVEGSEMDALRGAEASIRRFKPKLALSIYHKPTDFADVINFVDGLGLGYKNFVDHHTIFEEETVMYAIA